MLLLLDQRWEPDLHFEGRSSSHIEEMYLEMNDDSRITLRGFSLVEHPPRIWRQVCEQLSDDKDLLPVAELLAAGVTDSSSIALALGIGLETVEIRRAHLHQRVMDFADVLDVSAPLLERQP